MTKRRNIVIYSMIWILYISLNYLINFFQNQNQIFYEVITKYLLAAFVFHANANFILPLYFKKRKYFFLFFSEIVILIIHFFISYIFYKYLLTIFFNYPKPDYIDFGFLFPRTFWWYTNFTLFGFGFWYASEAIAQQKELINLQKLNFISETNFLKSQINPHFLHNSLNTIFSQALPLSEDLANNILRLSNMMRYSFESINKENGKVFLKDELKYLENLIHINQIRFGKKLFINFEQSGNLEEQQIPALSLITIVENAFKYGDLKDERYPLEIKINILENRVEFTCRNKKKENITDNKIGTGIDNLRKRLKFQFVEKHKINIHQDKDFYLFELTLLN